MPTITIERAILEKNNDIAARNRAFFLHHGILALNLVSSPGAGKTSLLEQTLQRFPPWMQPAVIEGDVQTDLDARRIDRLGIPVTQIVTNGGCHLEAGLVEQALERMNLKDRRIVFIENVGNLVCPANYDLGEHAKVVIVSLTEGDDKPFKYPAMFHKATALVVNKMDLAPYVPSDADTMIRNALMINPRLQIFRTSCTSGEGLDEWMSWVNANVLEQSAPIHLENIP